MPMFNHNINPTLLDLGPLEIRYYGLLFAVGVVAYYLITAWIFKREKFPVKDFDDLVLYLFVGLILGARFGHIVFYNLDYYLANPADVVKVWEGGLSSHGAAVGLFAMYLIFCWVKKVPFAKYMNAIVIGMPLVAGFVRVGNFFNSEIVGRPTDLSFGVVFERLGEDFARHPSQIYEALLAWAIFGVMMFLYLKKKKVNYLMIFVVSYFVTRFLVEFVKEYPLLEPIGLTMGQYLSIGAILVALISSLIFKKCRKN